MNKIYYLLVGLLFLLGGCVGMGNTNSGEPGSLDEQNAYEKENFVRIQDYKGEGFELRGSLKETGEIAKDNRAEIETAVQGFFEENYKTDVTIHNIVSAADGVSVFVESVGEPHFYTFAIVPVDVKNKEVVTDSVWSQEGQVENAIQSGLYAMAFDQQFQKLDEYFNKLVQNYPVVGRPIEVIENVRADGFATPYYYMSTVGDTFETILDMYLEDPNISKEDIMSYFHHNEFDTKYAIITVYLFMEEATAEPDNELFNMIVSDLNELDGIPRGEYTILLNDNLVDKRRGIGTKDNTLRTDKEKIIKE
ncbi:DUF1672 family protein [Sporosarcina sp. Marseille-Q4063]|uniref:DUF1672 family protein n=1 Tax=Sporosarcina sp. Marseille-Q4063 TaxID=2810514 RepID=UPI001BAF8018|nr:DUF1672 family protein [Sporosarcina sp. Marseille-Q4063]QUW23685.1 DUF1672 family protein [Sporosarcina sp. Marseille-Q4063]